MERYSTVIVLLLCSVPFLAWPSSKEKTLRVGPGERYKTPCQAMPHTAAGDIIEIDSSAPYAGDVCTWTANRLTLRGVGPGRAHLEAAGKSAQNKATWVIAGNDTTVENIELSGATSSDQNGAGIRQEGKNLTVRNCFFHENQEGILAGDSPESTILIEFSEFGHNGSGDGSTHNIYVNHVAKFVLQFSYSHHANIGHLVKTRAAENRILYNRLTDELDGTSSYELEMPNGGISYVIGNIIQQGPETDNSTILAYRKEGADPRNPSSHLYVVNNTFANDRPQGGTFIEIPADVSDRALIVNNIFVGRGTVTTQRNAEMSNNLINRDPLFADAKHFNYSLRDKSPARGAGTAFSQSNITVNRQYLHTACGLERSDSSRPDLGALSPTSSGETFGPPRCRSKQ